MRLFSSFQLKGTHYQNYLLLLVICLLAYWPLSFGIFSVKNDAIHYFLPYRFTISEAIQNSEWPFWSPYIYLGFPVYGDMQSGAWNPVVWLFSLISRYDATLFHIENLFYIFLAGIGMYKLAGRLVVHSRTALLIAISYMLSGFMLNGQLINWLAAAAFIPFVFYYYLKVLRIVSYTNAVKTGFSMYLLFTAGYPSFFIITAYLLTGLFLYSVIRRLRTPSTISFNRKKFFLSHVLILAVFAGLSLPAIISFIDLLPYYQRGEGVSYTESVINSFDPQHLLSFIFPSTIRATDVVSATDVTFRNMYVGLFTPLLLIAFPPKLTGRNILLVILAVFSFLFMLGDLTPVRKICYDMVPLLDSFRHPSQMKLFLVLSVLLLAAPGLDKLISAELSGAELKRLKICTLSFLAIITLVTVFFLSRSAFIKGIDPLDASQATEVFRKIIEDLTLGDGIVFNGLVQLVFLGLFFLLIRKKTIFKTRFALLWSANVLLMAQLILPVTFVGKTAPSAINAVLHASPEGFPLNDLEKSITENSKDALSNREISGLAYFYNKKPGISKITNSPSFLIQQDQFVATEQLYNYVAGLPLVYLADTLIEMKDTALLRNLPVTCHAAIMDSLSAGKCGSPGTASIKQLSSNRIEIMTSSNTPARLVLTQNYHHHWHVSTDGTKQRIVKTNMSFMSIAVPAGNHTTVFRFVPGNTIRAMWILLLTTILLFTTCTVSLIRQSRKPKPTE